MTKDSYIELNPCFRPPPLPLAGMDPNSGSIDLALTAACSFPFQSLFSLFMRTKEYT